MKQPVRVETSLTNLNGGDPSAPLLSKGEGAIGGTEHQYCALEPEAPSEAMWEHGVATIHPSLLRMSSESFFKRSTEVAEGGAGSSVGEAIQDL